MTAALKPCLVCGEPARKSRCPDCRGYNNSRWRRLSLKARALQPFCSDCGTIEDLQCDHLPIAWERLAQRKPLRLKDIDVVCRSCNVARGSTRYDTPGGYARGRMAQRLLSRGAPLHTLRRCALSSAYERTGTALRMPFFMVAVCGQAFPNIHDVVMDLPVTGTRHFQDATLQHFVGVVVAMFCCLEGSV